MAAKLQCEICGGKLIGRPGGIFECENCGTEYSTEWAKAKIQEITGIVKVEGTVEVTGKIQVEGGTVQVDSSANKEALLQRGTLALEDGKWEDAKDFFNRALDIDAKCAEAYLGLAMAEERCRDREIFEKKYTSANSPCRNNSSLVRARQFGGEDLCAWFFNLDEAGKQADREERTRLEEKQERLQKAKRETMARLEKARIARSNAISMISAGDKHTVGLKSDGTVVVAGRTGDVSGWTDIVAVSAGSYHTVGLKADGTVVAVGNKWNGKCDVSDWTDIVAIAAGESHTVGLKSDGTVVATKYTGDQKYYHGQCDVSDWTDIVAVAARGDYTVGLKADGTVVAAGNIYLWGQCDVSGWTDIVAIAVGYNRAVGLEADGTVVDSLFSACVYDSMDIVAVAMGVGGIVGLKADGTVVAPTHFEEVSDAFGWTDIVAIAAGDKFIVGLKADGTVVATGENDSDQCDVSDWKLFNSVETIGIEREAFRRAAAEKAAAERRAKIEALNKEKDAKKAHKTALERELTTLTGIFKAGKRKEAEAELAKIEARLAEIEAELKKLG